MKIGINFQAKDKYLSGVERYSLGLINALLKYHQEHNYCVITNAPQYFETGRCQVVHVNNSNRLKRIIWEHNILPRLSEKLKLDILHCPHYICPNKTSSVPYVVTIHDTIALDHPEWCTYANSLYYGHFLPLSIKRAHRIIAVSDETCSRISSINASAADKIRTINPGIDDVFFRKRTDHEFSSIKVKFNLPEKFLLYVGNIEPKKNVEHLFESFSLFNKQYPSYRLVVVGRRRWKSQKISVLLENNPNVIMTGYIKDHELACLYRLAEVLLFPSKYEGFGFPPLEAMASGLPVICSESGALKEYVTDSCITISSEDPTNTCNELNKIVREPKFRQEIVVQAKSLVGKYLWSNKIGDVVQVYKEVLDASGE